MFAVGRVGGWERLGRCASLAQVLVTFGADCGRLMTTIAAKDFQVYKFREYKLDYTLVVIVYNLVLYRIDCLYKTAFLPAAGMGRHFNGGRSPVFTMVMAFVCAPSNACTDESLFVV